MLVFTYCDRFGVVTDRTVTSWVDLGETFKGYCSTGKKVQTFRKEGVLAWLPASAAVLPTPRKRAVPKAAPKLIEIVITGFTSATKAELADAAKAAGMIVRSGPTATLTYLVGGPNAGPSKTKAAVDAGAQILSEAEFRILVAANRAS